MGRRAEDKEERGRTSKGLNSGRRRRKTDCQKEWEWLITMPLNNPRIIPKRRDQSFVLGGLGGRRGEKRDKCEMSDWSAGSAISREASKSRAKRASFLSDANQGSLHARIFLAFAENLN